MFPGAKNIPTHIFVAWGYLILLLCAEFVDHELHYPKDVSLLLHGKGSEFLGDKAAFLPGRYIENIAKEGISVTS